MAGDQHARILHARAHATPGQPLPPPTQWWVSGYAMYACEDGNTLQIAYTFGWENILYWYKFFS